MNDQTYNQMEGIRRSDLWKINQTPMHFRYAMDNPEEPTPALIFGRAAHKYILEPETFFDEFEVIPKVDRRTKAGKQIMEAFEQMNSGKTLIADADMQTIMAMRKALLLNPDAREIINGEIRTEEAFTWTDPRTGEVCKVKADIITEQNGQPLIVDYKTTASCADRAFERSARQYGYDFQAGMYTEGIDLCTMERHEFVFIAQEKTPPYAARVYFCDPSFVERGIRIFHDLLETYHECKQTNEWPGYENLDLYGEEI